MKSACHTYDRPQTNTDAQIRLMISPPSIGQIAEAVRHFRALSVLRDANALPIV
jgi:hypothetical protein